ncbi:hypothetical protein NLX67_08095 [Domibacillus sp. A3M-37]|uniref:hypothetical protein n=1 Tax=Domibacillus sp. A3M-37 TaxID=2962037 RepID=UPI0020B67C30|nr:hypothetical protein [Domibacillus sp. A3M-37]MCP3762350.1 hypothetical protein [Domibacillus sp. A3M-37]
MHKKKKAKDFCCPEYIEAGTPDDFCSPENGCPHYLQTPKYPSPSSCLPKEQQMELEAKIEAANELLLNLALSNKRPEEGRAKSFEGLIGQWAEVIIYDEAKADSHLNKEKTSLEKTAEEKPVKKRRKKRENAFANRKKAINISVRKKKAMTKVKRVRDVWPKAEISKKVPSKKRMLKSSVLFRKHSGRVYVVGRDFVLLKKKEKDIIIPLSKVHSIKSFNRYPQAIKEPALLNIDPCLRRSITFKFGETVASSPELTQLFFKMTMPIFLLHLLDKKVKIMISTKEIHGLVHEINKETLTIVMANKERKIIPLHSIHSIIA